MGSSQKTKIKHAKLTEVVPQVNALRKLHPTDVRFQQRRENNPPPIRLATATFALDWLRSYQTEERMIRLSTVELMDEQKCYDYLVEVLIRRGSVAGVRDTGRAREGASARPGAGFYFRYACGRIYNAFTGTSSRYPSSLPCDRAYLAGR